MSLYLDTSAAVPLFVQDGNASRARAVERSGLAAVASLWTAAEYSSALSLLVRVGRLTREERDDAEASFDRWLATIGGGVPLTAEDFGRARFYVQVSRTALRSGDALHLAVMERLGLTLVTFDVVMRRTAIDLGLPVLDV